MIFFFFRQTIYLYYLFSPFACLKTLEWPTVLSCGRSIRLFLVWMNRLAGKLSRNLSILSIILAGTISLLLALLALAMFFESCAIDNISQRQCQWLLSFDSYLPPFLNPALRKRMTFQLYHNIASGGASQMIQALTFAYR